MYDKTREPNEFVGESVEDATSSAARFFGLESSELTVVVARDGLISGAAGRTIVVAYPKSAPAPRARSGGDGEQRGRGGRERERGRERGDRDRDRDRGDREPRGRGRGRGRDSEGGGGPREREREEHREIRAEEPAPSAPEESKGTATGTLGQVGEYVLGVVERMLIGNFQVAESAEGDFLVVRLSGPASQQLAGGDGRGLDALQLLANQASKQMLDEGPRVVIDAEGEMADREESLKRLASRAAARAVETGRAIALDPMDSRNRRVIHMALREESGVATMSIGTGRYRQVVVVPEGAPEYEEALAAARQANSGNG